MPLDAPASADEPGLSMGLVFPLQLDLRRSTDRVLALQSTTKKFTVGGTFFLVGLILATMYLAASPLFDLLWNEGRWFDRLLAGSFYALILLYPFITLACWFYKEVAWIRLKEGGLYDVEAWDCLGPVKWNRRSAQNLSAADFKIENWKGAVNVASLEAAAEGRADRYATRGHWLLLAGTQTPVLLERRAKKEDLVWLKAQLDAYFESCATAHP